MREFYRRVRAGQPLDAALRSAQLALLRGPQSAWRSWLGADEDAERLRHPFYWAAFQLDGSRPRRGLKGHRLMTTRAD